MNKSSHTVTLPVRDYTELSEVHNKYYELIRDLRDAMTFSPLSQEDSVLISSRKIIDIYRKWMHGYDEDISSSEIVVG